MLGLQRRLELLSWAERHEGWIAEDDFDGEYRYTGRPLAPLRALDRSGRVAYLASFSKLLFPSLRLSYVVLPASLVPAAEQRMAMVPARASLIGQGALARFIADGHLATHLRRTRLLYAARQEALLAGIERQLARWLESARDFGRHAPGRAAGRRDRVRLRRPRDHRGGRSGGHRRVAAVSLLCRPAPPARPDPELRWNA